MKTEKPEVRYVGDGVVLPGRGCCSKGRSFNRKPLWQLAYYIGDAFGYKGFPIAVPLEKAYKASLEREYPERHLGILISIYFPTGKGTETNVQVEVINWLDEWSCKNSEGEGDRQRRIKHYQDLALGKQADIAILVSGDIRHGAKLVNFWTSEKVRQHRDYKASRTLLISRRLYTLQRFGALKDFGIMDVPNLQVYESQGNVLSCILAHFFTFSFMDMRD